jgi:hypothetical protein
MPVAPMEKVAVFRKIVRLRVSWTVNRGNAMYSLLANPRAIAHAARDLGHSQ